MKTEIYNCIHEQMRGGGYTPGNLTFGDCILLAEKAAVSAGTLVLAEAMAAHHMDAEAVMDSLFRVFDHNRRALEVGRNQGASRLMGHVGYGLSQPAAPRFTGDTFLDRAVAYTLATQVGNHCMGLQPCAGTGDACTYTGMLLAMEETIADRRKIALATAVMLKLGTLFREGKSTTGCNMEGLGAGAAAAAAAFTELAGGTPSQSAHSVVLAISPTIAVPCTPRVMVPGLCATHLGGGILIGRLASHLAMTTDLPVTVPVDHMMAMAAAVHPVSATYVVPEVTRHMTPFFQSLPEVEFRIEGGRKEAEIAEKEAVIAEAGQRIRGMAERARSILAPFDNPVAGGSSQGVGSPANTARLAHYLAKGRIRGVEVTLAPELFARRAINIPAILSAAVYGCTPGDIETPKTIFERLANDGVTVEIHRTDEAGLQKIFIRADEGNAMVAAENLGGARIKLREAVPSQAEATRLAAVLEIEIAA